MKKDIDVFLKYLADQKGCSENTLSAYNNDLNQLASFVQAKNPASDSLPAWSQLDTRLLVDYMEDLRNKKYAPATVARKVATAKSFVSCMVELGRLKANPTENLASPRVTKPLPTPLSVADVHALLAAPTTDESPENLRDQAMLQLLYASGMRVSQLVSLNMVDLDWLESTVRCSSRAAGSRCIPVPPPVMEKVKDYVDNGRSHIDRNGQEAVFLNQRGDRLTRQGFWLILKGYAEKAGLGARVTPHTLRHSFAVHKLDGGADLHDVQQLLGHTHILSTKVYQQVRTPV